MSALSAGISGIGYSRISVLPGPVRTAASTFSIMGGVSHACPTEKALRAKLGRRPGKAMDTRAVRAQQRRDDPRHRAGKRGGRLSPAYDRNRLLDGGTKALPL